MLGTFFFYALVIANTINMVHLGLFITGGNLYDIRQFKRTNAARKSVPRYKRKPLISVVIPAHNEEKVLQRTLDSVRNSTYKKIEIIVIDDGSTDRTAAEFRNYVKKLPDFQTSTYIRRNSRTLMLERRFIRAEVNKIRMILVTQANGGKASAMNNAIKNYVKGKYTMCLDADSIIDTKAIENAVKYFENPEVIGVAANVRIMDNGTFLSTLQRFEHMIGYRAKKFYTLTNSEFIVGGVASTYRTHVLKQVGMYDVDTVTEDIGLSLKLIANKGNKKYHIIYASDVSAMTEGVRTVKALFTQRFRWKMGSLQNLVKYRDLVANRDTKKYSRFLTMYRLPMAFFGEVLLLFEPLTLGYVVYLSFVYRTLAIVIGAYITITLYVLWTLWPDEHLTKAQKIKMSVQACEIYLLLYLMDLVQVVAIFNCLVQFKKVLLKQLTVQTWISPERTGEPVKA